MFALTTQHQFYFYASPCDMRKSFFTLSGIVRDQMHKDPDNGDVFIFINRSCNSLKILQAQNGGLVIYHKKLNAGYFKMPQINPETQTFQMTYNDLVQLVDGYIKEDFQVKKNEFLRR